MLLVTGITGHTGKYFLQELISHKYKGLIRCIVRETSDTLLLDKSGLNIEKVVGDLNDRDFLGKVMVDIDIIVHIYNIKHSPAIVELAIKNDVKRIILVHTTGIYSKFKYASKEYKDIEEKVSELITDKDCLTKLTILRPTMIYGDLCDKNISKFIKMVDKLKVIPVIDGGKSLIQPINARDLGKAIFDVLISPQTDGKTYDLSGEKPIKIIELFKLISQQLGKRRVFISVSLKIAVFMARVLKMLTLGKFDFEEKVQRMGEDRSYSHANAARDFGYKPISFEEGLQIEINQYLRK